MPFDSNGVFSLDPGYLAVLGQTIQPSQHNPPLEDIIQNGLSAVLVRDGRAPMVGNLNMNGFKATSLLAGTNALDAVNKAQMETAISVGIADIKQPYVDVASATTTDIGAAASQNVRLTGTTTITGLGTAPAGTVRNGIFADILTLTHNGTSLILPGAVNILTAAGDSFRAVSLGSGNWRVTEYSFASLVRPVGWEVIQGPRVFSGVANVDWADLLPCRSLKIKGFVLPSVDGESLQLRTSANNGSTYAATASDYSNTRIFQQLTSVTGGGSSTGTGINLNNGATIGNVAASEGLTLDVNIEEFNQAVWTKAIGSTLYMSTSGTITREEIGGFRSAAEVNNALRITVGSGTISGSLTLWGLRG